MSSLFLAGRPQSAWTKALIHFAQVHAANRQMLVRRLSGHWPETAFGEITATLPQGDFRGASGEPRPGDVTPPGATWIRA